jgi:copper resistance protein B
VKSLQGFLGALIVLTSTGLHAQEADGAAGAVTQTQLSDEAPPAMSHDAMPGMDMKSMPDTTTHAPNPALERPAASQHYQPPHMPGMDMDDATDHHFIFIENLEGVNGNHNGGAWDVQGWYGGDFNKLWVKSEGQTLADRTTDSKVEALWAHAILPFWDAQFGMRYDFSGGPSREWLAFGFQGISPYWFDIEATGYVGDAGRTAARLKAEYDLYLTQHLILKPEIELNGYGKADPQRQIGAGLSDGKAELRLRYEFTRGFAPYLGFVWDRKFGASATYARREGESAIDHQLVAGLQCFF